MTATRTRARPGESVRPRRWPRWTALAGAVLVVLVVVVAFTPLLGARTVDVRGAHDVTVAEVRQAAAVPHAAPLVRLDLGAIRRRVEALPLVASASVGVSYPSTVVVTIIERVAVGYLPLDSGAVLIDRTGDQFRTVAAAPVHLPRFQLAQGAGHGATGQALATTAAALSPSLRAKVATLAALDPNSVTLELTDGRTVFWGGADRSAEKAHLLPALLTQPGSRIDLSDPERVVVR